MKRIISLVVAVLLLPNVAAALCVQGDCVNGQGTVVLSDGRKYVGEFRDGVRVGRGLMTFPDGTKYLGDWQNDKPNGRGTLTSVGKFEYAGEFTNGIRHGQGTLETVDGKKYIGEWQNDVPHGQGRITYADGSQFVGRFENGRRNGEGEATFTDGSRYIGNWKDDLPNGQGTKVYPDGKKYSGEFRNGLMHGTGTVVMPDGSQFIGEWQGDVLVRKEEIVSEAELTTAEEVEEHVIAVVDDMPAEAEPVPAAMDMEADAALRAPQGNIVNSSAEFASVNQNGVFVRSGPSKEYRVIRSVYQGFPVQKIGSQDNWTQFKDFMGQEGWIYSSFLGSNNSAVVTATKANLRSGDGLQFNVVSQVDYGTVLQIIKIRGDWYMVSTVAGVEGWLDSELVWPAGHMVASYQDFSGKPAVTTSQGQQAYQEEDIKDQEMAAAVRVVSEEQDPPEEMASMSKEVALEVISEQQEIQENIVEDLRVFQKPTEAVEIIEAEPVVSPVVIGMTTAATGKQGSYASVSQNGRGANIRSEPSLAADVLRSVPPGYPLAIVEHQDDWVMVEDYRARRGWVYASLLADHYSVVIKVGKGNLRNGPSIASEIVAKLDYGIVMFIEEKRGEWMRVSSPEGLGGWLHAEVVWPEE